MITVGWCEKVSLPLLNIKSMRAKIDTGARTSAIHAYHVTPYSHEGQMYLSFTLHPSKNKYVPCEALMADERVVKSSNGHMETRYVIITPLLINGESWPIEITLTNRDEMGFPFLLGRSAMHRRLLVNPSKRYLIQP